MSTGNPVRDDITAALGADYEIIRELGRGGASVVYLARDRVLGREVAVKVVHDAQATDPEAIARFEREARTLASLQHPNIVMLYSARQLPGGTLALVMQHSDWTTLKARIRELGPLPIEEVEQTLRDVASALVYLHHNGVIHRDIKPENIFIENAGGRALISDFGIAKSADDARTSVTLAGVVIGTPAYMAPEQIDGGELTGRSDLYSLGMVGYEMLTGTRPWEGENLFGVIYKQKTERLPSLLEARPHTPENLRLLIERATEKEASARWQDAEEFLRQLTGSEVTHAPRTESRAVALVPATPRQVAPVNPVEYPTLEIDQAALASAFADEGRAELKRRRARRQRFLTAAVVVLLLTGGAGALAFSGREMDDSTVTGDRLAALSSESSTDADYLRPPSWDAGGSAVADSDSATADDDPEAASGGTNAGAGAAAAQQAGAQQPTANPATARTPIPQTQRSAPTPARPPIQRNTPVTTPVPELEIAQEELVRRAPPALLPALSVTRATGTEPRVSGGQVLQPQAGARAGSAGAPQLRNRDRVQQLLAERYPSDLRARGIGGTSVLTVLVSPDGRVEQSSLVTSSGNERLDEAAGAIVGRMLFEHPAGAPGQSVWISVPLTFSPR